MSFRFVLSQVCVFLYSLGPWICFFPDLHLSLHLCSTFTRGRRTKIFASMSLGRSLPPPDKPIPWRSALTLSHCLLFDLPLILFPVALLFPFPSFLHNPPLFSSHAFSTFFRAFSSRFPHFCSPSNISVSYPVKLVTLHIHRSIHISAISHFFSWTIYLDRERML